MIKQLLFSLLIISLFIHCDSKLQKQQRETDEDLSKFIFHNNDSIEGDLLWRLQEDNTYVYTLPEYDSQLLYYCISPVFIKDFNKIEWKTSTNLNLFSAKETGDWQYLEIRLYNLPKFLRDKLRRLGICKI
ncbi:MAG: hypothetical protein IPO85_11945 [Saprospiraceae bacterium]|uniref:Uncharacterized protein n=1 Tax=Candidatus Defluviibacterium haderslevense TaxID=2981993 RepID=A0A9D7SA52_9BACT|nr:hypothetical protein [Candidatus Defluviibacterium haderslevense]